ncbi:C6 transcription factor [Paraphoma chrysanthemicola]|uniref:C6 transcription factor n=1 Tax=Paraphoma chrysanthemicola TaxID=798071 RepID=A0A8K0RGT2_9PLEO|nr:C6 transcription factor [Paraphoma chrysanthemicola]
MSYASGANRSPNVEENNPRKRQRTACERCKSRKQRCDNRFPQCENCAKSGAVCNRPPDWEGQSNSYTRALEDQVAYLETRLLAVEQRQQSRPDPRLNDDQSGQELENNRREHGLNTVGASLEFQHNVADVVGILSLGSGNADAQSYVGSSSGYALATDLGRMVQATVWNKALFVATPGHGEVGEASGSTRRITLQELQSERAELPNDVLGRKLIQAYLSRIHPRFPFLFRSDVWEAHRCRHVLQRDLLGQRDTAPTFSSPAYKQDGFALFVLNMVYAIGALNLRLTEDYKATPPEQFYVAAMQHVASVREASSIHNLEATVLLILYHLRSESRNGLWHLTGLAMRTVTDIGLHREASTQNLSPFEVQLRRRLFWSVYALESILAGTLGRPISLSDSDIDQPLPLSVDDADRMTTLTGDDMTTTQIVGQEAYPPTTLSQFILLSQLHIFEARIQRTIYRVDRKVETLQPKMHRLLADLESWRLTIPPTLPTTERDRVMLHYHRAVRLLMQPFLPNLDPQSSIFLKCAEAAGQICQMHKRLHQTPEYGHSFVAVHTVFVAGITLLYTLWRGKDKVWSFGISNDIRAASCVLSIMGERAPWIRRFRDTFDVMVEATMAVLQGERHPQEFPQQNHRSPGAVPPVVDFSIFEELHVADYGTLDMAKELAEWI